MTRSLKVGLLHLTPELGAVAANRALIEAATRLGAGLGAEWVISGELVVSGYRFAPLIGTDWINRQPDVWMRKFARLSGKLGIVSFISHPERDSGGQLFNSLFVIGRDGQIIARQRKIHPTQGSEDWSRPGELSPPVSVDGIKVGLLICADAYNALPAQRLRDWGAELLVSSAAWWPGEWGPNSEWEARTLDTGLPLIVCNRSGRSQESHMVASESVIVDRGKKLLALRALESTLFVVECELSDGHVTNCDVAASIRVEPE
jgi:predicted amidohydrolase